MSKDPNTFLDGRIAACPYCGKMWDQDADPDADDDSGITPSTNAVRSVRGHIPTCDERVYHDLPPLARKVKVWCDYLEQIMATGRDGGVTGATRAKDGFLDEAGEVTAASAGATLGWAASGNTTFQLLAISMVALLYAPNLPMLRPGRRIARRFAKLDAETTAAVRENEAQFMGAAALGFIAERLAYGPVPHVVQELLTGMGL